MVDRALPPSFSTDSMLSSDLFNAAKRDLLKPEEEYAAEGRVTSLRRTLSPEQKRELEERERAMRQHRDRSAKEIMAEVRRHHSVTVMAARAAQFRARFSDSDWILDIGGGTGWYWQGTRGAKVLLMDFSLETLRVAERLLQPDDNVLLIHGDARDLPVRDRKLAGGLERAGVAASAARDSRPRARRIAPDAAAEFWGGSL